MDIYQTLIIITAIISQVVSIGGALFISWRFNHNKKKYIREQISCKKREIWGIQEQITNIVISKDKKLLESDYVFQLAERLKNLKKEIAELNGQLKPTDQDHTKLNVTESINMLNDTIDKLSKRTK